MRKAIIRSASSVFFAYTGIAFLFIFIIAMQNSELIKPVETKKAYTYLALGDSYTIGEKVPLMENFPNQVAQLLRQRGIECKSPKIIAKTGWTTDELEDGISKSKLKKEYDFVTLLIGVNDQYRGRPVGDYIPRFEALLKKALQFAGGDTNRIVVVSIPDWGATPFAEGKDRAAIAKEIDAYNAANESLTRQYNITYISITASTRKSAAEQGMLTEDGLHPSGREYAKWADEIAAVMSGRLR